MKGIEPIWPNAILPVFSSIEQVIHVLNEVGLRIVLVTDANGVLVGTISDGDIRRGLLRDLKITSPASEVMNRKPITVPETFSKEDVLQIMYLNKIYQIPIVDRNLKVVGLHVWDQEIAQTSHTNVMVIMAGGKGTRLLPMTERIPKPMLRLKEKPMLEHIIERAKAQGFSRFILAIHHLGEVIEEYFGDGKSLGVNISYIKEKTPLGTAGALRLIEPKPPGPIVVTNGDVLTDINYVDMLDFHNHSNGTATMAVQVREWQNPYGVVSTDGIDITNYEEKPITRTLINAGVYVVNPSVLELLSDLTSYDMPQLFELARERGMKTVAYFAHESWVDIGSHEDFDSASGQSRKKE
jgi:dTDP-glucose pyrophosphorylase